MVALAMTDDISPSVDVVSKQHEFMRKPRVKDLLTNTRGRVWATGTKSGRQSLKEGKLRGKNLGKRALLWKNPWRKPRWGVKC